MNTSEVFKIAKQCLHELVDTDEAEAGCKLDGRTMYQSAQIHIGAKYMYECTPESIKMHISDLICRVYSQGRKYHKQKVMNGMIQEFVFPFMITMSYDANYKTSFLSISCEYQEN